MASASVYSKVRDGQLEVLPMLNGGLAGLVSITAGADVFHATSGVRGGHRRRFAESVANFRGIYIDDGIGVVPVHLGAGFWGTLVVGFFIPLATGQSRWEMIAIQDGCWG